MSFSSDDAVRKYFKETACETWHEQFKVGKEEYLLSMIVTNYSKVYSQQNGNREWIVMNSGTAVKIG